MSNTKTNHMRKNTTSTLHFYVAHLTTITTNAKNIVTTRVTKTMASNSIRVYLQGLMSEVFHKRDCV